jgi:hypothetical protein
MEGRPSCHRAHGSDSTRLDSMRLGAIPPPLPLDTAHARHSLPPMDTAADRDQQTAAAANQCRIASMRVPLRLPGAWQPWSEWMGAHGEVTSGSEQGDDDDS